MRSLSRRLPVRRAGALLCIALATHPSSAQRAAADTVEQGTMRLHFLLRPVGAERYTIVRSADGLHAHADLDFTERGTRIQLAGDLEMRRDLTPVHFSAAGKSYRVFSVDTRIDARGDSVFVHSGGDSASTRVAGPYFTIDGYAPLAMQMLLVRYWNAHGRPSVLGTYPGDPTNAIAIERRGADTIRVDGKPVVLTRYSVDGVVWGHESLWLDAGQRLAAVTTTAGGLPFEGIRDEYASALTTLMTRANADRMTDLARLMRTVPSIASGSYAITGATIIDMAGSAPLHDAVLIVRDGKIAALGARSAVSIPRGMRTIDATGKSIIPGLWDMHAHASQIEWGPAYLAAGVTTIRDMGGEFEFLHDFRNSIASGKGLGPRVLLAGLVDGASPMAFGIDTAASLEQARAEVKRYHDAGFQQMKIYTYLKPDVVAELARAAHAVGMTVTGHVPQGMSPASVVDSGFDGIAHMAIRVDTATPAGRDALAFFVRHHTVVDPTLSWNELLGHSTHEPVTAFIPGAAALPYPLRSLIMSIRGPDTDTATLHQRLRQQAASVYTLFRAGLPVVAGTDKGVPALSLAREVELYVSGGFSPLEALQTATTIPARVMGLDAEVGTIAVGKRADLVVLDGDPLAVIANLRAVHWVVTNGRMYEPAALWRSVGFNVPTPSAPRR